MFRNLLLLFSLCCLAACQSSHQKGESFLLRNYPWDKAPDGSSSPLTKDKAVAIAKETVTRRQKWPDQKRILPGITQTVIYGARRVDNGGWRVIAHKSLVNNETGNYSYEPDKAAILTINKEGRVIKYVLRFSE